MSQDQSSAPKEREEPELKEDSLEEVAGGIYIIHTLPTFPPPTFPPPIDTTTV